MTGSSAPLLLAIDTSTGVASLAIFDGERVRAESSWAAGREHSRQVAMEVSHLVQLAGCSVAEVTGLAVARGPGSFTGVRVGLSVAKGMAAGLGVPLWGVDTLAVVAAGAEEPVLPVRAVVEAGRGRVATTLFQHGEQVEPIHGLPFADLPSLVHEPTLVLGEVPTEVAAVLRRDTPAVLRSPAANLRRAGYLALLGWRAAQSGDPGDAASVDAVYLPSATGSLR